MDILANRLSERLKLPLPGREAQFRMASTFRRPERYEYDVSKARKGGVLIALFNDGDAIRTVLMKRPDYAGTHSGQVSFPGGKHEPGDADIIATALREAFEEVAIPNDDVRVIGQLTELYIPPSNFLVHPVLGVLDKVPELVPDQHEVERILLPDLAHFLRDDLIRQTAVPIQGNFRVDAPYYDVEGHVVWGATAMILSELAQVLREVGFGEQV